MPIRRTTAAAVLAGTLALTACGSPQPGPAAPAAPAGPTEISVSLFGTFGYDEVGLFKQYEAENPGTTIRYESTQGEDKYWPALQTRLASGSGVADVQGIEVGRIADVVQNQADKWTDLRDTPAHGRDRPLHRLEGEGRHHAPTARCSGSAPTSARWAICYRTRPASARPACPPTARAAAPRSGPTGTASSRSARSSRPQAPAGAAWHDSRGRPLQRDHRPASSSSYYDASGNLVYATNPAVRPAWTPPTKAAAGGPDRQARAVRPRPGTRASPPGGSPPSPARPG